MVSQGKIGFIDHFMRPCSYEIAYDSAAFLFAFP